MHKIALLLCLLFFIGCTAEAPPTIGPDDKKLIDSLYLKEIDLRKPLLDSICEANFDQRVQSAVDSVLTERQKEIDEQVERLNALKAGK